MSGVSGLPRYRPTSITLDDLKNVIDGRSIRVSNVGGAQARAVPDDPNIPALPGAACKGMDTEIFFSRGLGVATARKICAGCPARVPCLEYALNWDREHPVFFDRIQGVWGGTNEAERRKLLREEIDVA